MTPKDRLIVALDVPTVAEALTIIRETNEYVGWYKVGLELIAAQQATQVIEQVRFYGCKVFYDIKLNDIPTTIGKSVRAVADKVDMINVHCTAGLAGMEAAVEAAGERCLVAAVTVLTSFDHDSLKPLRFDLNGHYTDEDAVGALVCDFARLARKAGVTALICSPKDIRYLQAEELAGAFRKITPGVRPKWAAADDQKRILTPRQALEGGSDLLVVGRPITNPPAVVVAGRCEAARLVLEEMTAAYSSAE